MMQQESKKIQETFVIRTIKKSPESPKRIESSVLDDEVENDNKSI